MVLYNILCGFHNYIALIMKERICLKHFCYENDLIYENVRYAMNNNKWYKNYYFKELQK